MSSRPTVLFPDLHTSQGVGFAQFAADRVLHSLIRGKARRQHEGAEYDAHGREHRPRFLLPESGQGEADQIGQTHDGLSTARRSVNEMPILQSDHALGVLFGQFFIMRDEDHRGAMLVDMVHEQPHHLAGRRGCRGYRSAHRPARFWVDSPSAGDGHALVLAAAQLGGPVMDTRPEPDGLQRLLRFVAALRGAGGRRRSSATRHFRARSATESD